MIYFAVALAMIAYGIIRFLRAASSFNRGF
jgi:hypothetical protein